MSDDTPTFEGMMVFNGDYSEDYDEERLDDD